MLLVRALSLCLTLFAFAIFQGAYAQPPCAGADPDCVFPDSAEVIGNVSPLGGCVPLTVEWENLTPDPDLCGEWDVQWLVSGTSDGTDPDWQSESNGVTFLNVGAYTVTLEIGLFDSMGGFCAVGSQSWTISASEQMSFNIVHPEGPYCVGDEILFDAQWNSGEVGLNQLLWRIYGQHIFQGETYEPLDWIFEEPGSYIVNLALWNSCSVQSREITVQVVDLPMLAFMQSTPFCQGAQTLLEVQGAIDYEWVDHAAIVSDDLSDAAVIVATEFDTSVEVVGTDENGCATTSAFDVVVTELPDPEVFGPAIACVGDELAFSASEPDGAVLEWQTGLGGDGEAPLVIMAEEGLIPVTVLATNDSGCTREATWVTEVYALPEINLTSQDAPYCDQPFEEILPAANPAGGAWNGNGIVDPIGGFDPSLVGEGVHTVSYTYTDANGCTSVDSMEVSVAGLNAADAGLDRGVCADVGQIPMDFFSPPGGFWTGPALLDDAVGLVDVALLSEEEHTWVYHYGENSCATEDEVVWTVQPLPEPQIVASALGTGPDLCIGDTLYLHIENASGVAPFEPTWSGLGELNPLSDNDSIGYVPPGTSGPIDIAVDVVDGNLCSGSANYTVEVRPLPVSGFSMASVVCANDNVALTNTANGGTTFQWSFGTGEGADDFEPTYTYSDTGFYTVSQTVTSAFGCEDEAVQEVEVIGVPEAGFSLDQDAGCSPFPVAITDTSYAPYSSWTWTLQDAAWNGALPPIVLFEQDDTTYQETVSLLVENQCGSSVMVDTVLVLTEPFIGFAVDEDTGCAPFQPVVVNTSSGAVDLTEWDWGEGTVQAGEAPTPPVYDPVGLTTTYSITLTGSNQCGSQDTTVALTVVSNVVNAGFALSQNVGCPPFDLTVVDESIGATSGVFDLGAAGTSNEPQVTIPMTTPGLYTIRQVVTNGCGHDTLDQVVEVFDLPLIDLGGVDDVACEGMSMTLSAAADNAGWAAWSFSDGLDALGLAVEHTFDAPGVYTAVFEMESLLSGCGNADSVEVTVYPAPQLDWLVTPLSGCSPLMVQVENASAVDLLHQFDFGDGSAEVLVAAPAHEYLNTTDSVLEFVVHYAAESNQLCLAEDSVVVTVVPAPVASFAQVGPNLCGAPIDLLLSNSSVSASEFEWSILDQDGQAVVPPFMEETPNWTLQETGSYEVTLVASNDNGCSDVVSAEIEVFAPPIAAVSVSSNSGCVPLDLSFLDGSLGADVVTLVLDSGLYSGALPEDTYQIGFSGTVTGEVVAISPQGCTDTLALDPIVVHPLPNAEFDFSPLGSGEDNALFSFTPLDTTAWFYTWDFGDGTQSYEIHEIHDFPEAGEFTVSLETETALGCTSVEVLTINIEDKVQVWMPNAFTPVSSGSFDGINDGFVPVIRGWSLISKYEFWVFDRWGNPVFHSVDPEEAWVGDHRELGEGQGTHSVDEGVYSWLLQMQLTGAGPRQYSGSVTVIR